MARKLEVEILANVTGYTKGLAKAGEQTKIFARTVDDTTKHVGRSLALLSGGFVAFSGATEFLSSSVDAARDAGVAQRSLAAQMKASGESFTTSQAAIEKAGLSIERFGFTSEDSAHALTVLERGTGNITRSIQLQGVAANLARAKNIGLADAANVLAKVFGGQETALRRAVPGLDRHAHGLDLIAQAQQRLAGQARAGTTEAERFSATLHDTEVIIGTALLPSLDHALTKFSLWLDQLNRSGALQKHLETVTSDTAVAFHGLAKEIGLATTAYNDFRDVAAKLPGGRDGFFSRLISGSLFTQFKIFGDAVHNVADYLGLVANNADKANTALRFEGSLFPTAAVSSGKGVTGLPGTVAGRTIGNYTPEQMLQNALAGDPNNVGLLNQQAAYDRKQIAFLQRLHANNKGPGSAKSAQEIQAFKTDLVGTLSTLSSISDAAAQAAKDAAQVAATKTADARKKAEEAAKNTRIAARHMIHTLIGRQHESPEQYTARAERPGAHQYLAPLLAQSYNTPVALQVALAREQATGASTTKTLKAVRAAAQKAVKSGKYGWQAVIDAYDAIANVNEQLASNAKGTTAFVVKYRRSLRGTQPAYANAGGGGLVINGGLHLHGIQDVTKLENELEARAKRRPRPRRGR